MQAVTSKYIFMYIYAKIETRSDVLNVDRGASGALVNATSYQTGCTIPQPPRVYKVECLSAAMSPGLSTATLTAHMCC